ncbi:RNA polymerase alpha subunit C-terminal domain-containing protein [Pedobacter sp. UC225_65]|uniref:RNA polymerase alpha subunit C-terminal domain-containing protein n=1 Tax=Pedobacter sp. UC225_65 TaxID=3350173 RepID=UPI00366BD4AD
MASTKMLKICTKGHRFYKSSDCPTCPICENELKPETGFLALLSAPARRALTNQGIISLAQLTSYTTKQILALHGVGPSTIPVLRTALAKQGLDFKGS